MRQTWTYGSKTIVVENGVVVYSNSSAGMVGSGVDAVRLKACGWRKVKTAVQYDAFGRKFGADGIERQ